MVGAIAVSRRQRRTQCAAAADAAGTTAHAADGVESTADIHVDSYGRVEPVLYFAAHCVFLHFVRGVAEAKCILVTRICVSVCLSLAAFPHYCMNPDVTSGNGRGTPSCALLGGFAIGARVSLL